jgi:hypothetical protein
MYLSLRICMHTALQSQTHGNLPPNHIESYSSTAEIGTKRLYLQKPDPVLYVVPLSHILGKSPLVPAGTTAPFPEKCTAAFRLSFLPNYVSLCALVDLLSTSVQFYSAMLLNALSYCLVLSRYMNKHAYTYKY